MICANVINFSCNLFRFQFFLIFCPVNLPPKIHKTKLAVITIISDLGNFSLEAAKVNGVLLKIVPEARVVNINNGLPPWQIMDGIYLLKQSFKTFPENTIHLFGVNNKEKKHIMAKANNHWFLAPDNGALPEILKESETEYFDLGICDDPYFMYSFYPDKVKSLIASEFNPNDEKINPLKRLFITPVISGNRLKAFYSYFDYFGNAHVNLNKDEFHQFIGGQDFTIFINHADNIDRITENYYSAQDGELIACFNSGGFLEISYVSGNATRLFGLRNIEFVIIEKK